MALYVMGFTALAGRLVYVQAIQPARPAEYSTDATLRRVMRPAHRGSVLDANGVPLVMSEFAVTVRADPAKVGPFAGEVAHLAAPLVGLPEAEVRARLQPAYYRQTVTNWVTNGPVRTPQLGLRDRLRHNNGVVTNLSVENWTRLETLLTNRFRREVELAVEKTNVLQSWTNSLRATPWWHLPQRYRLARERSRRLLPIIHELAQVRSNANECRVAGLCPEFVELRVYPLEYRGAHVLGYTTNSTEVPAAGSRLPVKLLGAAGVEQRFDRELQGSHGVTDMRRAGGHELVPLREREIKPVDGLNLVLSLDANVQAIVEDALDEGVKTLNPKSLSAVVVRPRTGEILALANRPTWNPNTRRITSLEVLQNRAVMQPAEPGSTFKLVTYSAALDLGLITLDQTIDCEGGQWKIPGTGRTIRDDQSDHYHVISARDAFAHSSNVGAVKLGLRVGTNALVQYIRNFGFLAATGIEHGEFPGSIPHWDGYTGSSLPYGYALYVTPLQTAMAAAAIANDGVLMEPRLVRRLVAADGRVVREFGPRALRQVIRPETAHEMIRAMRQVVVAGTGKLAALPDFDVAGKTGTARKARSAKPDQFYASFVGFFPAENPEVCIMIAADEPATHEKGYYGGKACAPIFARIGRDVASYLALPPNARTNDATALSFPPTTDLNLAARP